MFNFPNVFPNDLNSVLVDLTMQAVLAADDNGPEMADAEAEAVLEDGSADHPERSGLWILG